MKKQKQKTDDALMIYALAVVKKSVGNISGVYGYALTLSKCDDVTIKMFLYEIACQANECSATKRTAVNIAGKRIVRIAQLLYPEAQPIDKNN